MGLAQQSGGSDASNIESAERLRGLLHTIVTSQGWARRRRTSPPYMSDGQLTVRRFEAAHVGVASTAGLQAWSRRTLMLRTTAFRLSGRSERSPVGQEQTDCGQPGLTVQ